MSVAIVIALCVLLLIAYAFDLTSAKTKVPSVILLLALGWSFKKLAGLVDISLPNLTSILPILGTIGLIMIVLEGSLELELNKSKFPLIGKSFSGAFFPVLVLSFIMAGLFSYFGGFSFRQSLLNAIPLCIISSAIAIPSVRNEASEHREFVTYESSFSDIIGVLMFNFLVANKVINGISFGYFMLELLLIIVVSFVATLLLAYLLKRIDHHIKFIPIILMIILIYEVSKLYHLPGLIFILLFGLFLGNLDELKNFKWIQRFGPEVLNREVLKFKELTVEATFLIRALFFLVFGYMIETAEVLNPATAMWAVVIVLLIFLIRAIQLKISKLEVKPLLFIAPRGLITILLFLSIDATQQIPLVNRSLVIQVIILTALVMMVGLMSSKTEKAVKDIKS